MFDSHRKLSWLFALFVWLLSACEQAPANAEDQWQISDLRSLESPGTRSPELDLVASYARRTPTDLELRFDFLGSPDPFGYDLYLTLDIEPDQTINRPFKYIPASGWDILFHFPAKGRPLVLTADGSPVPTRPRIFRNGLLDSLTIRVSRSVLPDKIQTSTFQAFVALPGEHTIADTIGPVAVDSQPISSQAPVLLVFWDSLPSATPAQALRRWNGAHTGPYGQRHGLSVLLDAASSASIPIAVMDLKTPASLAAIEVLDGLPILREMQQNDLLLLPDLGDGDPHAAYENLTASRRVSRRFGLETDPFFYGAVSGEIPSGYQAAFAHLSDSSHLRQWNNIRLIPLPQDVDHENGQAGAEGLTTATRLKLLQAALSSDAGDLVVLGGSLPASPWGDLLVAGPAFEYIAGHPWLKVLDRNDLLNFPTTTGFPDCPDLLCLPSVERGTLEKVRIALAEAPDSLFSQLAWHTYRSLNRPVDDERLVTLRSAYLGQTGYLLAASRWNQTKENISSCESDLDWDGETECVLASEEMFLVFERQGARLMLAAAQTIEGPIQFIGPRSQFVVGLGDPQEWQLEEGVVSDPQDIPGGFSGPPQEWQEFLVDLHPTTVTFTHPIEGTRKAFHIEGKRLQVHLEGDQPVISQLPLALLDNSAYTPGWYARYKTPETSDPHLLHWELSGGAAVEISAQDAQISLQSFTESLPFLGSPEDPNFGYPPGHYTAFPLAVVEIQSGDPLILEIRIIE